MTIRHNNLATAVVIVESISEIDSLPIEDLEEDTVNDYKKLGDKLDTVMSKIKCRKENKKEAKKKK